MAGRAEWRECLTILALQVFRPRLTSSETFNVDCGQSSPTRKRECFHLVRLLLSRDRYPRTRRFDFRLRDRSSVPPFQRLVTYIAPLIALPFPPVMPSLDLLLSVPDVRLLFV